MQSKIMEIVKKICNAEATSCRGLNKSDFARELMDIANVPQNADIQEIPLDWGNQVVVLFLLPEDKNYYSLFAGIGNDGNFYFELSITGKLEDKYFEFYDNDIMLPLDYFKAIKDKKKDIRHKVVFADKKKDIRYKVVFMVDGEQKETVFNGYDEKEKANLFRNEYISRGYENVRIEIYFC